MAKKKVASNAEAVDENASSAPQFLIENIYLKDCSFEAPKPLFQYEKAWDPEANIDLRTRFTAIDDDRQEVVVEVTVNVALGGDKVFVVEVHQGGTFLMRNIPDADLDRLLQAFCPSILFPYAREAVSELVQKGGFPPLYLNPVDFEGQYQLKLHQQKLEAEAKGKDKKEN